MGDILKKKLKRSHEYIEMDSSPLTLCEIKQIRIIGQISIENKSSLSI